MDVQCPACGQLSRDPEFCDHCNAELARLPSVQAPRECPSPEGILRLTARQAGGLAHPEASLTLAGAQRLWRLHWIPSAAWPTWKKHVDLRPRHLALPIPDIHCVPVAQGTWVMAAAASDRIEPWNQPRAEEPEDDLQALLDYLQPLAQGVATLHQAGLVWLNFDPEAVEAIPSLVAGSSQPRFTNMDLQVFPVGSLPERLAVRNPFMAPEVSRFVPGEIGPATDVYHLAVTAYYWLAGCLPGGLPGQGPEAFAFAFPPLRIYNPAVVLGVGPLLARGLHPIPAERFASPGEFIDALADALARQRRRPQAGGPLRLDIGHHSRTGRTKTALKLSNEDRAMLVSFKDAGCHLAAVADGISSCDVGSGELASLVATIVLENHFNQPPPDEEFPRRITVACRAAAQALVEWALDKGYQEQLARGADLMGTTLVAAWISGRLAQVANLGDSRAYLIDAHHVEQLTVDGDLGSNMLAQGLPPEDLAEVGAMARALRECIGGCHVQPGGKITIFEDGCRPNLSRWHLQAGDTLILCTDGLVEEGAFLDPQTLGDLTRRHAHLSAQDLAHLLVERADQMQRLPSSMEPEGFGDNITCLVVKIVHA